MNLYKNIKALRLKSGMSQGELAKRIGYTDRSSIAKIENGDVDLSQSKIQAFADVFHVTPSDLMGDEMLSPDNGKCSPFRQIPLYAPLCCGNGAFVDDNVVDYVSLPIDRLNPRIEYFCQIAQGDSMIGAGIHDGDVLVFEKSSSIDSGQIGCFCIDDNDAVCKRYKVLSDSQILLMPANDKYDPIPVDVLSHSFRCLGILRWAICDMDGR